MFAVRARMPALLAVAALALAGCSPAGSGDTSGRPRVVVGFYAAQYLAEQIGGPRVEVTSLTRPGAEPHDVELTAKQLIQLAKADLVVTESHFQPAVDQGIAASAPRRVVDLTAALGLNLAGTGDHEDAAEDGHDHEHEAATDPSQDPHFWLDPQLMRRAADAVAAGLSQADPAGTADYTKRAAALDADLTSLDGELRSRLSDCAQPEMVTSHAAYAHLAAVTGLHQHALALNPESEPTAAQMAAITDLIRTDGVRTIYVEPLAPPRVAEVIAAETGAQTAVLDPIEGLNARSAAGDYLGLMRANIDTLAKGQQCRP